MYVYALAGLCIYFSARAHKPLNARAIATCVLAVIIAVAHTRKNVAVRTSVSRMPSAPEGVRARAVSGYVKKLVAADQNWRCRVCNQMLPACYDVDHVVPLYRGGTNDRTNLQALCRNCHGNKTFCDAANDTQSV